MTPEHWQNVNDLFHAAIERTPPERSGFLVQACAGDATLMADVAKLVSAHEHADAFIERPALAAMAPLAAPAEEPAVTGQQFGSYRIIREIGRGGMGAVYLAERADQQYEKLVAIKVIKRGMDTESVLRRFRNEQQILASLDCPNIARIIDAGTTQTGLSYFVMEYIEGLPIAEYANTRHLSITQRLELFRQICSAVTYAHQRLIIHRDIKPSNILVTPEGVPKLVDFGIAKILAEESGGNSLATIPGLGPMTPEYASPEQVRGRPVTPASDVYSLGVVLYELLTGCLPYRLETRSPQEIERLICDTEPEKPSTAQPEKLRSRLAGDLDNIVLMALRKEPERRYRSADELSEDIRRHLEDLPVIARKDTLAYRSAKFIRRNKAGVVQAALFAAVLITLVLLGVLFRPAAEMNLKSMNPAQTRKLVVLPFVNLQPAVETDFLSYSMADAVSTRLSHVGSLSVFPPSAVYDYRTQSADPIKAAHALKADAMLTGNYLKDGDVLRVSAQLVDVAGTQTIFQDDFSVKYERMLSLHDTLARRVISALNLNLSPAERDTLQRDIPRRPKAWEFYLRGIDHLESARLPLAMDALEESVALDPQFAWAWTELGEAYVVNAALRFGGRGMYDKAQAAFDRAIALNAVEPLPRIMMSDMFIETNRVEEAVSMLRGVVRQHPRHAMAIWQLSYAYRYAGMLEESVQAGQAAYEADPTFTPRSTVFNTWLYLGQYEKFRDTLPQRDGSAYLLFYRAFADYHLKDFARAAVEFDRAYALDPAMLQARVGKALSYEIAGQRAEGLRLMRETAQQVEKRGLNDAEGVYKIAQAFAVLGDHASALRWLHASVSSGFFCYPYIQTDPLLENLRSSPEFHVALQMARERHETFKRRFF